MTFYASWLRRTCVRVPVLGRKSFVLNKRATGRTKDVADLESLGEA
ncbi:MAG TPA: hypothetical protein VIC24_13910 [Gemmatimonadaceae bacterium]